MTLPPAAADIAIVGMSGSFPGARTVEEFYTLLSEGRETVRFLTNDEADGRARNEEGFADRCFIPAVSSMADIDLFDAHFFGMTPQEAELTDPQHRLLLEHCWRALEHAGYDTQRYSQPVGVFAGATINTYLIRNLLGNSSVLKSADPLQLNIANGGDFLTTRISYKLNLKGPSHTVQSACSTSLVAVHCACRSLLDMESDMALAGGVSVNVNLLHGYRYQNGGIMSPDGHCRVFDAHAAGTIFGSGVGVVVLKRLQDAVTGGDTIHAIIKGSAVNNDGALKAGFTAPSVEGQAEVIAEAIANAGVNVDSIGYVECHGTGTLLGDPVEVRALTKAFRALTQRRHFCALGSVKSNIGHLDAAAGVVGLIKVVLSLKNQALLPTLHFREPNPQIDFSESPFYVNTEPTYWKSNQGPRRAGVSAFGVGGTNAHVVLEEAPTVPEAETDGLPHVLVLSARSESALRTSMNNLAGWFRSGKKAGLADVANTLQLGRRQFAWRWAGTCADHDQAVALLEEKDFRACTAVAEGRSRRIAFLFPGQATQNTRMGLELYEAEPVFRQFMQQCAEIVKPHLGFDLCHMLYPDRSTELGQPYLAQPALFAMEYSLAQLWSSWGVKPEGMLGHSLGEYTAACVAGVMTLEEGMNLAAARGKLIQQLPGGAMLAVKRASSELDWVADYGVSVTATNAADLCTLAGGVEQINALEAELRNRSFHYKRLRTSHAFHSPLVEAIMPAFRREVDKIRLKRPSIPYVSNVTGTWIRDEETQDPSYWATHLRAPVQFARGLKELVSSGDWCLLETGPGDSLTRIARKGGKAESIACLWSGKRSESASILHAVAKLWTLGINFNWPVLHKERARKRLPLPTYPFERKRYWIEPASFASSPVREQEKCASQPKTEEDAYHCPRPVLRNSYVAPRNDAERIAVHILERALGIIPIGVTDRYGELGGDSLTAVRVIDQINAAFGSSLGVVDLYDGLAVRDLLRLIDREALPVDDLGLDSTRTKKRELYRQSRRALHLTEPTRP
jgi:phthiocerol/phenolphthiocerol synthesis type-I polyketide synthase E